MRIVEAVSYVLDGEDAERAAREASAIAASNGGTVISQAVETVLVARITTRVAVSDASNVASMETER